MKINVGEINLYYKIKGNADGKPLILLHGNGEDHTIFSKLIKYLEKDFKIYAADSRGHGKSDDVEEYHYDDMVEDIRNLIDKLNIDRPALIGFSDGGIVGLMLSYKYPKLLSRAVICGANLTSNDLKENMLKAIEKEFVKTKDPKMKLMLKEPNIKDLDLAKIEIPIFLTAGEKDIFKKGHAEYISGNIKNSRYKIFKNENHESYILSPQKLYDAVEGFLLST